LKEKQKPYMKNKNLKEFKTTKSALQQIFKGILHIEGEDKHNHENKRKSKSH
jgi:hypothetical protein